MICTNITSPKLKALVVCLIFFVTEFLGAIRLGPVTIRHIAVIFMILYILRHRKSFAFLKDRVFRPLVLYFLFVSVLGIVNELYDTNGINLVFAYFLPSVIVVLFICNYVDDAITFRYVLYGMLILIVINAIVTILQGINHPLGWFISSFIQIQSNIQESIDKIDTYSGDSIGLSVASGLPGAVVANGYYLASFGLLFTLPMSKKANIKNVFISIIIFIVILIGLFYNQQRSAFYVFIFLSILLLANTISIKNCFFIVIIALFINTLYSKSLSNINWGRLADVDSSITQDRASETSNYFSEYIWEGDNLLLGNSTAYRRLHNGFTPHNMFAETTLQGGIFGLLIYMIFLYRLFISMFFQFKRKNKITTCLICTICGIILVSLTHSSGFHTGYTTAFYAYAYYVLSKKYASCV